MCLSEKCEYAELGYCIGYAFWNNYLFSQVGVNRIGISHAVKNPASGRVAQKCGLTYEGTKREYFKTRTGEFLDMAEYGILKREWIAGNAARTER